jgi:hypothetical protein
MPRSAMPPSAPVAWSDECAFTKASQALEYLAENYPECGGIDRLDSYHHAVHDAAIRKDRVAYEEALRDYMRASRREALATRRERRTRPFSESVSQDVV